MNIDFQPPRQSPNGKKKRPGLILLVLAGLALASLPALFSRPTVPATEARSEPVEIKAPPEPADKRDVIAKEVNPGDTITSLLGDYFSPQEILQLSKESREVFPLTKICAGQPYKLCLLNDGFERFEYDIDREEQLIIEQGEAQAFRISKIPIEYTVRTDLVRGTISSSLFEAVTEIGEEPELAITLSDIFAWDIDFLLDIREGDSFQALVEKRFRDGKPAGYGRVLAAEFVNQGDAYRAFWFQDGDQPPSYYDASGQSLRKAFLKAPLEFSRISSGFTMRRFHPITKTWKAHPAIDYVAPVGTPIKAVGDGTIARAGYSKGNGNFVDIRHNNSYQTLYLHMKGFARGIKKGKRVAQGQIIGYVGATGLATGPHLCFRMRQNGAPVNPNKIKFPAAAPIAKEHRPQFKETIAPLQARLDNRPQVEIQVAQPQHESGESLSSKN